MWRLIAVSAVLCLLAGCAGRLYTIENPGKSNSSKMQGVIAYQPKPVIFLIETTHAQDKHGTFLGSANDNPPCKPIRSYEITTLPDYGKRYVISYEPGLFESNKFSLELSNGVVTKINTESTSAAKETLEVLAGLFAGIKEIKPFDIEQPALTEKKIPSCNVGKKIVGRVEIDRLETNTIQNPN